MKDESASFVFILVALILAILNSSSAQEDLTYWLQRGHDSYQSGSYQEAQGCYDRVLKIDPENASALVGKGKALAMLGRYKMAELCFDLALKSRPRDARLWLAEAMVNEKDGDYIQAGVSYDQALAIDDSLAEAWLGKGNISFEMGDYNESLSCYENASRLGAKAQARAGMIKTLLARGTSLLKQEMLEAALKSYDEALEMDPLDPGAKCGKAAVLVAMGQRLLADGRVHDASRIFENASLLDPENQDAVRGRVRVLVAKGNALSNRSLFSEALEEFEAALSLSPTDSEALAGKEAAQAALQAERPKITARLQATPKTDYNYYLERGAEDMRNGSYAKALENFNKSIQMDGGQAEAWFCKGQALFYLGRLQEAATSLDKALEKINPTQKHGH